MEQEPSPPLLIDFASPGPVSTASTVPASSSHSSSITTTTSSYLAFEEFMREPTAYDMAKADTEEQKVLEEFKASLPALYSSGRQNGKSNGV
jgi:hypothetical protein